MQTGFLLAFTTGLLGGFGHCLGMCGPLVASYTLHGKSSLSRPMDVFSRPVGGFSRMVPHLMYNAGRITTYSFVGALMGLGGSFLNTAGNISGIRNAAALLTGLIMIVMGLRITGLFNRFSGRFSGRFSDLREGAGLSGPADDSRGGFAASAVRLILESGSSWRYYPLGLLFGFIPCGLAYSIFMGSAGQAGLLQGMLYALCFGLGTIPALLLFGFAMGYLSGSIRGWLYKGSGLAVIISGVYFIVRAGVCHARM